MNTIDSKVKHENYPTQILEPQNWVNNYKRYLFNVAFKKLPKDLAEDIVQDTFLAALNSAHRFKGSSSERVWLTAILRNKIADHYRNVTTKNTRVYDSSVLESKLFISDNLGKASNYMYNPIMDRLNEDDLKLILLTGMEILSSREYEIVKLKTKGLSTEAICEELQISRSNCWVLLHRARRKLQEYLNRNW